MRDLILAIAAIFTAGLRADDLPGTILLHASNATINADGGTAKYETKPDRMCVGFWNSTNTSASWKAEIPARGAYRVIAVYAAANAMPGSDVEITVGPQRANGIAKPTGEWGKFTELDLGPVLLRKPGTIEVTARATRAAAGSGAWNLRAVKLVPEP